MRLTITQQAKLEHHLITAEDTYRKIALEIRNEIKAGNLLETSIRTAEAFEMQAAECVVFCEMIEESAPAY